MKRWLKEPLLHFLLAGALLFGAYGWLNGGAGDDTKGERVVRITAAQVEWLEQIWTRQWQRPPSEDELKGLVASYLKEELFAREAKTLGLDENDTVVRRRLAQKLEFLVQDTARLGEPDDEELRRFYEANRDRYHTPARISFAQIYFKTESDGRRGLEELSARDASELGDRIMLEREYAGADVQTVTSLFGREFADKIFALEAGQWHGPVPSGYGFHLVRISERQAAQPRDFATVKGEVLTLWRQQREEEGREQYFAALLKKYDVVVDDSVKPLVGAIRDARYGMRDTGKQAP